MSQTSGYDFALTVAQAGQLFDIRPDTVITLTAEVAIAFGRPVRRGTNPETQALIANATAFEGVAVFTQAKEQTLAGVAQYEIGDAVSVVKRGAVWVITAVAVVAGENAYVTSAGAFTNVATSNLLVGKFETSAGIGGLAVLAL